MAARTLADMLPDFGRRPAAAPVRAGSPRLEPPVASTPAPDLSVLIAEKVAEAEAALTERLTALYEATLEAERKSHEEERERLLRELGTAAADRLAARLAEAGESLLAATASAVSRILSPILTEEMHKRAVAALTARIREALDEREAVRVRVYGPLSLLEALTASLGSQAGRVEFFERPSFDVTVDIDSTIYQTRLTEWSAALAEMLS